jgi:hypothetical protein
MAVRTQKRRAREPFPAPPAPGMYKKIAYSFVALTVIILFAALWFSSVRATVWITAAREPTAIRADVDVAREPERGELAGRVVQGVFEAEREFSVTQGQGTPVAGIATGRVRIFNTRSSPQPLVVKTRLLTPEGRLYRIREGVTVPSKGSVDVEAYADEEGGAYDFTAKKRFSIPGLSESMQEFVYAESITPFSGGERIVRSLAQADVDAAAETLRESLVEESKTRLRAEAGDARFTDAVFLVEDRDIKTDVNVGENAESFLISMSVSITGVFYSRADMESLVREQVKDRVPQGREIVSQGPSKMTFEIERVEILKERAGIKVDAEVITKAKTADNLVSKEAIIGLPVGDAESRIEQMAGVEEAEIVIRPGWVRRLPTLKDHITLKIR